MSNENALPVLAFALNASMQEQYVPEQPKEEPKVEPVEIDASVLLTAAPSKFAPLFDLLYSLIIDYDESGDGKVGAKDTLSHIRSIAQPVLKQYKNELPGLKDAVAATLMGKEKTSRLYELGVEIKDAFASFHQESYGMTSVDLDILKGIALYLRTDSEAALTRLKKFASITGSPFITQKLTPKHNDQKTTRGKLEKLLRSVVGRSDVTLTADEANIIKQTKPEVYKEYLALRKEFNQSWRDFLVALVRKSGKQAIPYEEVIGAMDAAGLHHLMPRGFTGLVDDLGKLYTADGQPLAGAPSAVTFPEVKMNPHYGRPNGGDWVMQALRMDGSPGPYYYTEHFAKSQAKAKFAKVADLSKKMESIHHKWLNDLRKFDEHNPNCVIAAILECLFVFSARVGGAGNGTGGQSTYGISTLLVQHAKIDPSGNIVLRYKGKAGVPTKHVIPKQSSTPEMKMLYRAVYTLLQNKDPKERIFTVTMPNGRRKNIPGGLINGRFKALGAGNDVTVHKIRTYVGTKVFEELANHRLQNGKKPKDDKQMLEWINDMAADVGKKLNHMKTTSSGLKVTGTTALSNYIDPTVVVWLCREWGRRPPKFLEKFDVV